MKKRIKKKIGYYLNKKKYLRPAKQITIEITTNCNFKCKICPHSLDQITKKNMSLIDFENILIKLKPFVRPYSIFTPVGLGEPFLHPNISDILKLIRKYYPKNKISLNTNCSIDITRKISALNEKDRILFSLNKFEEKEHQKMSQTDFPYLKILNNIQKFLLMENRPMAIVQLINVSNTEFVQFQEYWKGFLNKKDTTINRKLLDWGLNLGIIDKKIVRYPCLSLWISLVITYDSKVFPCCCTLNQSNLRHELEFGSIEDLDLKKYNNFLNILKKKHLSNDYPNFCKNCDSWSFSPNYFRKRKIRK